MKHITYILLGMLLACRGSEEHNLMQKEAFSEADSVIVHSQQLHDSSNVILKEVDAKTDDQIQNVIHKVEVLQDSNEHLKMENAQLKEVMRVTKSTIIRDTIYIREKTNFWGKKKLTTDSTSTIVEDSTITQDSLLIKN